MDGITYFITRKRGIEVDLGSTKVNILLYANNIVLLSKFKNNLQRHLKPLMTFAHKRGMIVNPRKTKVLIFHTSALVRTKCSLMLSNRQIEVVRSYV